MQIQAEHISDMMAKKSEGDFSNNKTNVTLKESTPKYLIITQNEYRYHSGCWELFSHGIVFFEFMSMDKMYTDTCIRKELVFILYQLLDIFLVKLRKHIKIVLLN